MLLSTFSASSSNKKGKKQKRLILDARIVNWLFVSPPGVSLCSSEAKARIEVCLPEHVEEGSPEWHSALESIELSLGLGDIRDCFHRYVLDDEFASGTRHFEHVLHHLPVHMEKLLHQRASVEQRT